jgi:Lrp/AsnC family transcriptional regulator, leucine-responsive regulatory protein
VAARPLRIQVRLRLRPEVSPSAMETAAVRLPAVYAGSVLAGDHDLQLHLACRDAAEVTASIAELRRCGAAECHVEVVLRGFLSPRPGDPALPYPRTP